MSNNNSENPIVDMLAGEATEVVETEQQEEVINEETNSQPVNDEAEVVESPEPVKPEVEGKADTEEEAEEGEEPTKSEEKAWWDDDEEKEEIEEENDYDFSAIGNAIGEDIKSKSDLVEAFNNLKSKYEENKETLSKIDEKSPYANNRFEKANAIAVDGGDWEEYLGVSQTNWDSVGDRELIAEVKLRPVFGEDGDSMMNHLNSMSEADIKIEGAHIRNELKNDQTQRLSQIERESSERKAKINNGIKAHLGNVDSMYGMKLTPGVKESVLKDLTSDNFLNSVFHNKDGSPNFKGMVEASFLIKNIKSIMKHNMTKHMNKGREEIINEVSSPNMRPTGSYVAPKKENKDSLDNYMDSLKSHGAH